MGIRIALLADLCEENADFFYREFAGTVFLRTLHYLNEFIRPDAVILTGSLTGLPDKHLDEIRKTATLFEMPFLSMVPEIRGVSCPAECGEFLICNRLEDCRPDRKAVFLYNGTVLHDPSFSAVLKNKCCSLCITHPTCEMADSGSGIMFCHAPSLCKAPYRFSMIEIADSGKISVEQEQYRLPPGIADLHVHTPLAYCSENMDCLSALKLAELWGLDGIAFTEHSGHLYFTREQYWNKDKNWYREGLDCHDRIDRTSEYWRLLAGMESDYCLRGMELDVDSQGRFVAESVVLKNLELKVGAIHALPEVSSQKIKDKQFFFLLKSMVESGIDILAHPFRVYSWEGVEEKPVALFEPAVDLLRKHRVAVEINFHHNRPDPVFTSMCLDAGVRISFGSDSHNLYEVGFFQPHLRFLRQIGFSGKLEDILFRKEKNEAKNNCTHF